MIQHWRCPKTVLLTHSPSILLVLFPPPVHVGQLPLRAEHRTGQRSPTAGGRPGIRTPPQGRAHRAIHDRERTRHQPLHASPRTVGTGADRARGRRDDRRLLGQDPANEERLLSYFYPHSSSSRHRFKYYLYIRAAARPKGRVRQALELSSQHVGWAPGCSTAVMCMCMRMCVIRACACTNFYRRHMMLSVVIE